MILWLVDNPEWAYASIVRQIGWALQQYRHEAICMVSGTMDKAQLAEHIERAAVVVPMYVLYLHAFNEREKVAMFLSGVRPFE